jgi:hypothetical protein
MRLTLATALAVATLAAAQESPRPEWREYKSAEGRFKVSLPGEVKAMEKKTSGGPVSKMAVVVVAPGRTLSVSYFDVESVPTPREAKQALAQISQGLKGKDGKILSDTEATFGPDKLPSRDVLVEGPKSHTRNRTVIAGRRVYQVLAVGPKEFVTSKDVDKVFDSFETTK